MLTNAGSCPIISLVDGADPRRKADETMAKMTRHEKAVLRHTGTMRRAIRENRATSFSAAISRPDDDRLPFGATLTIIVDGRKLSAWCSTNLHILEKCVGAPVACPILREAIARAID